MQKINLDLFQDETLEEKKSLVAGRGTASTATATATATSGNEGEGEGEGDSGDSAPSQHMPAEMPYGV